MLQDFGTLESRRLEPFAPACSPLAHGALAARAVARSAAARGGSSRRSGAGCSAASRSSQGPPFSSEDTTPAPCDAAKPYCVDVSSLQLGEDLQSEYTPYVVSNSEKTCKSNHLSEESSTNSPGKWYPPVPPWLRGTRAAYSRGVSGCGSAASRWGPPDLTGSGPSRAAPQGCSRPLLEKVGWLSVLFSSV